MGFARQDKACAFAFVGSLGERTSPFITFWHMGLGKARDAAVRHWGGAGKGKRGKKCVLATSRKQLPFGVMDVNDPNRRVAKNAAKSFHRKKN